MSPPPPFCFPGLCLAFVFYLVLAIVNFTLFLIKDSFSEVFCACRTNICILVVLGFSTETGSVACVCIERDLF